MSALAKFSAGDSVAVNGARGEVVHVLPLTSDGEGNSDAQFYRVRVYNGLGPDTIKVVTASALAKGTW